MASRNVSEDPTIILSRVGYRRGEKLSYDYYSSKQKKKIEKMREEIKKSNEGGIIGNSIFTHYNAIKLANIDAVFNITSHNTSIRQLESERIFSFCDLIDDGGGYTEYLQWRLPYSRGYGVNSKEWDLNTIDMRRMELINRRRDNYPDIFISSVMSKESWVDLVIGTVKNLNELNTLYYIVNKCCKIGGYFICHFIDLSEQYINTLYRFKNLFKKFSIFKPLSCYADNSRYFVFSTFRKRDIRTDISKTIVDFEIEKEIEIIPAEFVKWINEQNKITDANIPVKELNHDKALLLWNLPGNIDPKLHV